MCVTPVFLYMSCLMRMNYQMRPQAPAAAKVFPTARVVLLQPPTPATDAEDSSLLPGSSSCSLPRHVAAKDYSPLTCSQGCLYLLSALTALSLPLLSRPKALPLPRSSPPPRSSSCSFRRPAASNAMFDPKASGPCRCQALPHRQGCPPAAFQACYC